MVHPAGKEARFLKSRAERGIAIATNDLTGCGNPLKKIRVGSVVLEGIVLIGSLALPYAS